MVLVRWMWRNRGDCHQVVIGSFGDGLLVCFVGVEDVCLKDLVGAGMIDAGAQIVSVIHQGVSYSADLSSDGHIQFQGALQKD